jgi:predicted DNA-binding antitoxin AbrB/MazE fold protein
MSRTINAVYENGVLRPLSPLALAENQIVSIVVSDAPAMPQRSHLDVNYLERLRERTKDLPPPPGIEEVRRIMAKIPGSLSDDIAAEREDL